MQSEAITPQTLHQALRAIRFASRLRTSPLIDLAALGRRLAAEGLEDSRLGRAGLLPRWLEEIVWAQLARQRGADPAQRLAERSLDWQLARLADDFLAHSPARETWGVLYVRYFAASSHSIRQLVGLTGVAEKTLRRRLDRGYELLAEAVRELELAAVNEARSEHALPEEPTAFIGREADLAAVRRLMADHPLVTLTGPGGMGKSRLAVRLARDLAPDLADGACFISLTTAADDVHVPATVLAGLGQREVPGQEPVETVVDRLAGRHLLLVLDNCERSVEAVSRLIRDLLSRCPSVQVLATSREILHVEDQAVYAVPPMALPAEPARAPAGALHYDAVRLFARRAATARPGFAVGSANAERVARLCARLDGIPLAIELAAARVRFMTLDELEDRLADRFALLRDDRHVARPGHETMRAALDGSFQLLSPPEQAVFARLAVFQGGWTPAAAEAVCAGADVARDDVLSRIAGLKAKSLIVELRDGDASRHRMLETVREYAWEHLAQAGDAAEALDRHADAFLARAEEAAEALKGAEQAAWLGRLDADHDNLAAALKRLIVSGRGAAAVRLAAALGQYWLIRGRYQEGRRCCAAARAVGADAASAASLALLHDAEGDLAREQGDLPAARAAYALALELKQALGDRRSEAVSLRRLGAVADMMGFADEAADYLSRSLAAYEEVDDAWGMAAARNSLGLLAYHSGDLETARRQLVGSLDAFRALGESWAVGVTLTNLANVSYDQNLLDEARARYEEALTIARKLDDPAGMAAALHGLGNVANETGDPIQACQRFRESLALLAGVDDRTRIAEVLESWASVEAAEGRPATAAGCFGAAARLREAGGFVLAAKERSKRDRELDALRRTMGGPSFDAAWDAACAAPWSEFAQRVLQAT